MSKDTRTLSWLLKVIDLPNVADELSDDVLNKIGMEVTRNYDLDLNSRADWEQITERAMKLAKQVLEKKTFPTGEAASSVKFPLLTEASIQFASRAYPELLKGSDVVKCQITGDDPDNSKQGRADRISTHMSYQLTKKMSEWLQDMDQALHIHPIIGGFVKKPYFNETMGRNVSELVSLVDYVVNQNADRHRLRRETHRYWYYRNDILEKMRAGLWREIELGEGTRPEDSGEDDIGHEIIEQHCFYDLDGDGYKEPWIITCHRQTSKVLRVVARFEKNGIKTNDKNEIVRIEPTSYFTVYRFFPDLAGGFYPMGLGQLLEPLNESINTIINQLIDAGTLSNRAGGLVARGVRLKGGIQDISPFKWRLVDTGGAQLRDAFFPFPVREPSAVLFSLLGLLIEAARGVANLKEVLSGETKTLGKDISPTTYMGLVEQGLKVFIGIYKRFYDSLTDEFRKLYRLNSIYLEPEETFRVSGKPYQIGLPDYQEDGLEVLPVADPNMATDMLRRAQDQALIMLSGRLGINEVEITRRAVRSLHTGEDDKLLLTDQQLTGQAPLPYKPPPNPKIILAQARMQDQQAKIMEAGMRFKLDVDKHQLELQKLEAEINELTSKIVLNMAKAKDIAGADAVELYQHEAKMLAQEVEMKAKIAQAMVAKTAQQGGTQGEGTDNAPNVPQLAQSPGNAAVAPGATGSPAGNAPAVV